MEAEIRAILSNAVSDSAQELGLGQALMTRFAGVGAADVELPRRTDRPRAQPRCR